MNWYAIYTKSRNEKKLAELLEKKGFEVYAPTQTVYRQWSDRKKKVQEVLFKSYVFVRFDFSNRVEILQTPGAVRVLTWLGKPAEIKDEEIEAIKTFLNNNIDVKVENIHFTKGDILEVKTGSLRGQVGEVLSQSKYKVVLYIEKLGIALTAEIPKNQVEKSA